MASATIIGLLVVEPNSNNDESFSSRGDISWSLSSVAICPISIFVLVVLVVSPVGTPALFKRSLIMLLCPKLVLISLGSRETCVVIKLRIASKLLATKNLLLSPPLIYTKPAPGLSK